MEEPKPHCPISVHQALGGGLGVVVLVSATAMWLLFERAGYNLLSFVVHVLFLLILILLFWAKAASLLNRSPPPLPDLTISEESISNAADILQFWINRAMYIARDKQLRGIWCFPFRSCADFLTSFFMQMILTFILTANLGNQLGSVFWVISVIGSLFNFLTLIYLGVLLSLSVPLLYDKYQDQIDDKLYTKHRIIQSQYGKFVTQVLRNISIPSDKAKKMEHTLSTCMRVLVCL